MVTWSVNPANHTFVFSFAVPVLPAIGQGDQPMNLLDAVPCSTTPTIMSVITAATVRLRTRSQSGRCVYRSWDPRLIEATAYGSQCTPPFAIVW